MYISSLLSIDSCEYFVCFFFSGESKGLSCISSMINCAIPLSGSLTGIIYIVMLGKRYDMASPILDLQFFSILLCPDCINSHPGPAR